MSDWSRWYSKDTRKSFSGFQLKEGQVIPGDPKTVAAQQGWTPDNFGFYRDSTGKVVARTVSGKLIMVDQEEQPGGTQPTGTLDTGNPSGASGLSPADRARSLGLQSNGKGGYMDDSGNVVARTVNNELVFYDNGASGGVVSDGGGGMALSQSQPSWVDPDTGLIMVPPAQPETPSELAAIPDPTPATPPMGFDTFVKQRHSEKKQQKGNPQPEMPQGPMSAESFLSFRSKHDKTEKAKLDDFATIFEGPDHSPESLAKKLADKKNPVRLGVAQRMAAAYERQQEKIQRDSQSSWDKAATARQGITPGQIKTRPEELAKAVNPTSDIRKDQSKATGRALAGQPLATSSSSTEPTQSGRPVVRQAQQQEGVFSHPAFNDSYPTSDEDFMTRLKESRLDNGSNFVDLGGLLDSPIKGINQKYLKALSRGLVANKSSKTKDWSLFSEGQGGGAGENASRFGELMSLIFSSADDNQAGILEKQIRKSLKSSGGNSHVDESWLDAALQNRTGIRRLLKFENEGKETPTVAGGAWDVPGELEALGIGTEGGEKKGFSTDMVTRDSNDRNYQVSLKKGGANRLLNSTAANYGRFIMDGIRENGTDEQKAQVKVYDDRREDFNNIFKAINGVDYEDTFGNTPSLNKIRKSLGVSQEEARNIVSKWEEFKEFESTYSDQFVPNDVSSKKFIDEMNSDLLKGIEENKDELLSMNLTKKDIPLMDAFQGLLSDGGIDLGTLEDRFINNGKVRNTPLAPRRSDNVEDYAKVKKLFDKAKSNTNNLSDFNEIVDKIGSQYPDMNNMKLLEALSKGGGNQRDKNKIMYQLLANTKNGQSFRDAAKNRNDTFVRSAMKEISQNPLMRSGVLQSIRKNFPLKDVANGSESMVIGDSVLSKRVLKEMFGTDNYENIKDNLQVMNPEDGSNPYLAYRALVDPNNLGEFNEIPIADVGVRQDGIGYGPTIKHEMTMRQDFFKKLQEINSKLDTSLTAEEVLAIVFNRHMIV